MGGRDETYDESPHGNVFMSMSSGRITSAGILLVICPQETAKSALPDSLLWSVSTKFFFVISRRNLLVLFLCFRSKTESLKI